LATYPRLILCVYGIIGGAYDRLRHCHSVCHDNCKRGPRCAYSAWSSRSSRTSLRCFVTFVAGWCFSIGLIFAWEQSPYSIVAINVNYITAAGTVLFFSSLQSSFRSGSGVGGMWLELQCQLLPSRWHWWQTLR